MLMFEMHLNEWFEKIREMEFSIKEIRPKREHAYNKMKTKLLRKLWVISVLT